MAYVRGELVKETFTKTATSTVFDLGGAVSGYFAATTLKRRDGTDVQDDDTSTFVFTGGGQRLVAECTINIGGGTTLTVTEVKQSTAGGTNIPDFTAGGEVHMNLAADNFVAVDNDGNPLDPDIFRNVNTKLNPDEFAAEVGSVDGEAVKVVGYKVGAGVQAAEDALSSIAGGFFVRDENYSASATGKDIFDPPSGTGKILRVPMKVSQTVDISLSTAIQKEILDVTNLPDATIHAEFVSHDGLHGIDLTIRTGPATGAGSDGPPAIRRRTTKEQWGDVQNVEGDTGSSILLVQSSGATISGELSIWRTR